MGEEVFQCKLELDHTGSAEVAIYGDGEDEEGELYLESSANE